MSVSAVKKKSEKLYSMYIESKQYAVSHKPIVVGSGIAGLLILLAVLGVAA